MTSSANQMVRRLLDCVYLTPGDHEIRSRLIDHSEETNAVGVLFDILNDSQLASTMPAFDSNASRQDGYDIFPGAVMMGRLFSYVVRGVGMKNRAIDSGALVPIDIATFSYANLEDSAYMRNLSVALTRTGHGGVAIWTLEAEAFHVARGVEAFFRGCLSINANGHSAAPNDHG